MYINTHMNICLFKPITYIFDCVYSYTSCLYIVFMYIYVFMCSKNHNIVYLSLGQLGVGTSLLDMKDDRRVFSPLIMLTIVTGCYMR